jgi:general secretion pathway protein N
MRFLRGFLIGFVVLAAIAGVAAGTCPADLAYRLAADAFVPVRLHDLTGSIWQGHAGAAEVLGVGLGAIDWTLQAQPLLRGEIVAQVTVAGEGVSGSGIVERSAGETSFRAATLRMPARVAAPVLAIPMLELLGTIEVDIAHARLRGRWFDDAAGTARWRDAAVAGAAQAKLGDLQATFASTPDSGIAGVARDLGGPLELAGTFKASVGAYEAQARLAARGDNAQLAEALQFIGQPQADGSRNLEIRGRQLIPPGS